MKPALGVFGGMFDPVHLGHIHAARYAIDHLDLQKVLLVPCGKPNHRSGAISSGNHRLAMLRLATADADDLEICDYEVNREGTSYSVDTLRWLSTRQDGSTLVFIVGMDTFNDLQAWHQWQDLFELCNFMVLARSGLELDPRLVAAAGLEQRRVYEAGELLQHQHGKFWVAGDFDEDVSSTGVRQQLQAGITPDNIQDAVLRYINEHRLYGRCQ